MVLFWFCLVGYGLVSLGQFVLIGLVDYDFYYVEFSLVWLNLVWLGESQTFKFYKKEKLGF